MRASTTKRNLASSGGASTKGPSTTSILGAGQPNLALLATEVGALSIDKMGWSGVEAKFYELQGLLSAPTAGLNASQARQQQKTYVTAAITVLLDNAHAECRRLLIRGDAKAAVEGGLQTLRLKQAYYGEASLPLVPAYFHLARTNQFLDKFKAAEEFLSLAQWTILQHPEADVSLKAELHQTFGLLYASDARLDAALKQLTCATYYLSVMNGPEHVVTSFGYFDIGNVFAAKGNMESAMAFYDKVKDIWHTHLTQALRWTLQQSNAAAAAQGWDGASQPTTTNVPMGTPTEMGEENVQDAAKMLRGILALQTERLTALHPSTTRASYVQGMFLLWVGDTTGALEGMLRTVEACRRLYGDRHPSTIEVRQLITAFGMAIPEDTSSFLNTAPASGLDASPTGAVHAEHQQPVRDSSATAAQPPAQKSVKPASPNDATPSEAVEAPTVSDAPSNPPADNTAGDSAPPEPSPSHLPAVADRAPAVHEPSAVAPADHAMAATPGNLESSVKGPTALDSASTADADAEHALAKPTAGGDAEPPAPEGSPPS